MSARSGISAALRSHKALVPKLYRRPGVRVDITAEGPERTFDQFEAMRSNLAMDRDTKYRSTKYGNACRHLTGTMQRQRRERLYTKRIRERALVGMMRSLLYRRLRGGNAMFK